MQEQKCNASETSPADCRLAVRTQRLKPRTARCCRSRCPPHPGGSGHNRILERYVVVAEIAGGFIRLGDRSSHRLGLTATRGRGPIGSAGAGAAAEHLHVVGDDLGAVMGLAFLFVGAGAQAALDINLRTFLQVFAGDFRQAVIEGDAVPLGAFLLLAALQIGRASCRERVLSAV